MGMMADYRGHICARVASGGWWEGYGRREVGGEVQFEVLVEVELEGLSLMQVREAPIPNRPRR